MSVSNPNSQAFSNQKTVLAVLSVLFFMWGFITVLNSILMPDLMLFFELNYEEALMLNISFFSTYFILGSPVGKYVDRVCFRKGIVMGIYVAAVGCFIFFLAAENRSYLVFLLALFILGTGITILQTGANPY